jgi:folylpolyglutamate synthase/dihydropteroate synthase
MRSGAAAHPYRFSGGADDALFADREWGRAHGLQRSRNRAAAFARELELDLEGLRARAPTTIIVAGSKGKGTAATYASATLAAAGLRVGTLTSPGLRSNRERIRVDGRAVSPTAYAALVARVGNALAAPGRPLPDDGYLSPTGLFTLAAVRHFLDAACDAWVLEAGMGGASDEVSLFAARVVALTPIFGEHLGIIGNSVGDIAREKLGVVSDETEAVVTQPQVEPEAASVLREESLRTTVRMVRNGEIDGVLWPPDLVGLNARLGVAAARDLLGDATAHVDPADLRGTLASIALPGRMSMHQRGAQTWFVDAATNARAASAALRWSRASGGGPHTVLACIPDGKDAAGVRSALESANVTPVRTDAAHLAFSGWSGPLPSLREIDLDALGARVLALGTVHFMGDVLELLGVDTECSFRC